MSQPNQLRTRYPGLASFTTAEKDLFFGRKQETRDLANLLSVERTVVLFSASGIGKTSLLQAGVMPLLYGQLMVPVPIRFGTADLLPEQHFSTQLDAAAQRFAGQEGQRATDSSARETFWGQIARQPFGQMPAQFTPLFIFDQFEELFTLYPEREKRARFVAELADIIQERLPAGLRKGILTDLEHGLISPEQAAALEKPPPMRFIFSIRSDMLHFMDELSEAIPYILRSRFQLFGLDEKNAREALVEPASLAGAGFASRRFGYTAGAQAEILEVLGKKGEVESFQLQAVCQAIEEKIIRSARQKHDTTELFEKDAAGLPLVAPDFYGGRAGIDAILDESYNRRIESLAETDEAWPARARHILEDVLVNKNDRRQSVDVTSIDAPAALLDELERQRLVRKEARLESFYYEISHDTWLKAALSSKKIRQQAEKERLEKLEKENKRKQKEERRKRRVVFVVAVSMSILAVFAVLAAIFAFFKTKEASRQREIAVMQTHKAEQNAQKASEKTGEAERQTLLAKLNEQKAAEKTAEAEQNLNKAHAEEERARLALMQVESEKAATEIQRQEALKNLATAKVETKRAEAEKEIAESEKARAETERERSEVFYKMVAKKQFPENFDPLIPLDSLDCSNWGIVSLSTEIGKLLNLKRLNLSKNKLTSLPAEIGNLKNLQLLYIGSNELMSLPAQIGKLKNLTILDLNSNQLTALPSQIGELKNLTGLNLHSNRLTALSSQIGELKNLTQLYLNSNQLTALLSQIGDLNNLTELHLSGNQLTMLPSQIGELKNLTLLLLSGNQLTMLPSQIGELKNLTLLDLNSNQLTMLPSQIGELKNLTLLLLSGNQLTALPSQIGELKNLTLLDLNSNQLTALPSQIGELKNLTILNLNSNKLTSLPEEITELKNLTKLVLDYNKLTELPIEIGELKNLKLLFLKGNPIPESERAKIRALLPSCAIEF